MRAFGSPSSDDFAEDYIGFKAEVEAAKEAMEKGICVDDSPGDTTSGGTESDLVSTAIAGGIIGIASSFCFMIL